MNAFPFLSKPEVPNLLYQRAGASFFAFAYLLQLVIATLIVLFLMLFPISFAIAILRYRLWDIDILVRRTLIYSALSVSLAMIYLFTIILLEGIYSYFTGQEQADSVIVISTLAIAAISSPLRRRIQENIDRNFYRQKYDAVRTLEAFSSSLREEVDLDGLCNRLAHVAEETMQPLQITLLLKPVIDNRQTVTDG